MSQGKRYIVFGDYVRSRTDGDLHYISAARVAELYGVPLSECILHETRETSKRVDSTLLATLHHLRPRYDGNYTIPDAVRNGPLPTPIQEDRPKKRDAIVNPKLDKALQRDLEAAQNVEYRPDGALSPESDPDNG